MIFKVTPCDVFFTVPTPEELQKAEETVTNLCQERILVIYKDNDATRQKVSVWLDAEFEKMRATGTGFHFLILRDIALCSREAGYPIIALGNLSGSVIAYLLGITEIDPFEYYTPEIVWGLDTNPIIPDCTIGIAPQVRPLIPKYLDSQHGFVPCDREMFRKISLVDVNTCEQLGVLAQETEKNPTAHDIKNAICLRAAKDILEEFSKENGSAIPLVEGFNQPENWNLHSLLRLYAFTKGEFSNGDNLMNLNSQDFFVTREEFYHCLVQHNVPVEIALDIVKKGVWATGEKREKYNAILESYQVPASVKDYYTKVQHLWTVASCVGRVLHKCYLAWYQENCPETL